MSYYNDAIDKAVDRLSELLDDRFHGYRCEVWNIIHYAIEEATQPTAQQTDTCKWKRLAYNKNGIASPHDDFKMRATRKDCPTCGKRIEVVE